jgi:hypothetical protein
LPLYFFKIFLKATCLSLDDRSVSAKASFENVVFCCAFVHEIAMKAMQKANIFFILVLFLTKLIKQFE